ncbi:MULTISPECIES: DUF3592 domain-containing protein [Streptomyces]|uniref:DUF3592 domain-containing protein n=1 Tax=Streptomyces TaxID=1883 RepID=UPI000BCBA4D4|nr:MULTISPECIES: DUF3592 domain-containing protein [Streptomyces]MDX2549778.1 DUF3592 domain-containing protein [Streptomyces stelliscabiei]MDX2610801.1 DUF3592 domain-containing protein [Streptomyces stelliscabiei]MDX2635109.1 DUF3592 domain-containing protein [Streptomyces stelliscabiei]MDX2660988.1 DUF3592 domain-containing protein [Streptomyces stelliscabiei]MDX2710248.1 DUF3592 domain-containing protein [Streptomyces stelliscabiei]
MDAFFYLIPVVMMTFIGFMAFRVLSRWLRIRRAWNSGLTAEARCLRTFTTVSRNAGGHSSVHTTIHHVYEFTTRDGRAIRFEEEDGPMTTVEGDFVTVYYTDGPNVIATAHAPGERVKQAAAGLGILAFLGVAFAFCVFFMVTYHQYSTDSSFPTP